MGIRKVLSVAIFLATPLLVNAQAPAFTQVIVFGDSLSDDGNIAHRARDAVGFSYPSSNFNYSDYRFTDDTNTAPAANLYTRDLARTTGKDISRFTSRKKQSRWRDRLCIWRRHDQERHAGAHYH